MFYALYLKLWNTLPNRVVQCKDLKHFKDAANIFLPPLVVWKSFQLYTVLLQWSASFFYTLCERWPLLSALLIAVHFEYIYVMNSLNHNVWRYRYLCRRTKIRQSRVLVLPVLLYDSEVWSIGARELGRLNSFSTPALRRIMGYRWDNFVSNDRLLRETGVAHQVTCMIRQRQLRLFGHVARYPESDPVSRVISEEINPAWRKPRGRPPVTCLQRIDGHCRELGLRRREHACDTSRRDPQGWCRALASSKRCLGVCCHYLMYNGFFMDFQA